MKPDRRQGFALGAAVAAIAAVVLALVLADDGNERAPSGKAVWTATSFFGVNAPVLRNYATPQAAHALDKVASSMAAAGVSWARVTFDQSVEERTPAAFDWTVPDAVVAALARHGVRTQALFYGTAAWAADSGDYASCGLHAAPHDVNGWAGFVHAAVARYGRNGEFWSEHPDLDQLPIETWEISNEENTHVFWCPDAAPERYADLYSAARSAALDADPDALVIVGGLAPAFDGAGSGDITVPIFLQRMVEYDPDLTTEIPAVAIHPYAQTSGQVLQTIGDFRDAMRRARLGDVPMIVNEVGWYTSGPPGPQLATQAHRAQFLRAVVSSAEHTDCNVVAFGVHSWVTAQSDPANPEDWYGLADPVTGRPNESGRSLAAAIKSAESARPGPAGPAAGLCE